MSQRIRPPLAHWLQECDPLAQEFETILGLEDVFGDLRAAILKELIFCAPLGGDLIDKVSGAAGTFTRASADAFRLDQTGNYQLVAANIPRPEFTAEGIFLGTLFEPAITNKCTNYNASPDAALLNCTKGGDAASVLQRVEDSAILAASGLSAIGNGYVIELDNSAGSVDAHVTIADDTGNVNAHTLSAFARKVSGAGQADIRYSVNGAGLQVFTNTDRYERVSGTGAPAANSRFRVQIAAGVVARFLLNQSEELATATSPIITRGATASRAADYVQWALPAGYLDAKGTALFEFIPRFDGSTAVANGSGIVSINGTATGFPYYARSGASYAHKVFDGTNATQVDLPGGIVLDRIYRGALRWNGTTAKMQVGAKAPGGAWSWAAEAAYDGSFDAYAGPPDRVACGLFNTCPQMVRVIHLYGEDLGQSLIEQIY